MSDKNFKVKNGIDAVGPITISPSSNSITGLIINSVSGGTGIIFNRNGSQVGSIDEWGTYNGSGISILQPWYARSPGIESQSFFWVGSGSRSTAGFAGTSSGTNPVIYISQTGTATNDLTQWIKPDNTVLAKIDYLGNITANDLTLSGNLTVNGTTTNLNSTNLVIEDKNIIIADVATPTDTTADGAGITIKGATDKTLNWVQSTKSFTTSEPVIINNSSTDVPTLIVKLNTGQTSNIQEWQNNTGTVLADLDKDGMYEAQLIQARNTLGVLASGESQIKVISPDNIKDIRVWNRNDAGGLYYFNSNGGSGNLFRITHSTTNRMAFQFVSDFTNLASAAFGGRVNIDTVLTSAVGLVIRGVDSQTADLQQWQNSSGTVLASINSNGGLFIKPASTSGNLLKFENTGNTYGWSVPASYANSIVFDVNQDPRIYWGSNMIWTMESTPNSSVFRPYTANRYAMSVRGLSGQTADLQQWQNSSGTTLAKVDNTGNITAPSYNLSNSLYSLRKTIKKTVGDGTAVAANTTYDLFQFYFPSSLQGTFYFQVSLRGSGYGQNLTYSLPATYAMDWLANGYSGNLFTNNTTWVSLTPQTFSGRHLMVGDNLKLQARVHANTIYFRLKANAALSSAGNSPYFDVYIQHSEEFDGCTITESSTVGTDTDSQTTLANFLSSKGGTTELFNPVTIFSNSASNTPIKIKAYASQTANLQEWQNSSSTVLAKVTSTGMLDITPSSGSTVSFRNSSGALTFWGGNSSYYMNTGLYLTGGSWADGRLGVDTQGAANKGLVVRGAASQSANLQEWQDSSGTLLAKVASDGLFKVLNGTVLARTFFLADGATDATTYSYAYFNTSSGGQGIYAKNLAPTVVPLTIMGYASQTANLQEWQDSTGTVKAYVRNDGLIHSSSGILGTGTFIAAGAYVAGTQMASVIQTATNIGLLVKGAASQTSDLQQWQNSSGTVLSSFSSNGRLAINSSSDAGGRALYVVQPNGGYGAVFQGAGTVQNVSIYAASGGIGLLIAGAASQTSDLQQWQNSAGTVLAKVQSNGVIDTSQYLNMSTSGNAGIAVGGLYRIRMTGNNTQIEASVGNVATLIVKSAASQTADLQQWQDNSGTVLAKVDANGNFSAISKSFDIEHPTKENMRLRYASLEGPENGVYVRGTATTNIIELPDYWTGLVHEDSITVSLTSVGSAQNIYVEKIEDNKVYIGGDLEKAFFTVYGERKDVAKLVVEQ